MADRLIIELRDTELQAQLTRAIAGLARPTELMQDIGAELERNINERFANKVDPRGDPWKPLSPGYLEWKNRKGETGSLLKLSGMMQQSLAVNASADQVEIGFGEEYAGYHETGSKDGRLPQRSLLTADWRTGELGAEDRADVIAVVEQYLADLL